MFFITDPICYIGKKLLYFSCQSNMSTWNYVFFICVCVDYLISSVINVSIQTV